MHISTNNLNLGWLRKCVIMGKVVRKPEATTGIQTRDPTNSRLYRQIRYKGALTLIYEFILLSLEV